MKKSLIAAVVFASASFASTAAMAASVGTTPQVLDLGDGSAYFGDTFNANNNGNTFADRFTFTISDTTGASLNALASSFGGVALTGLSLYNSTGDLVPSSGTWLQTNNYDLWTLTGTNLSAGNYYLQVSGNLTSDNPASFSGSVALAAPVPEPETYGMMLAGLGVLGFLARRRKAANQA